MSEEKESFQPGDRIGDYEVVSVLGFGATGTVYLAQHSILKKLFAVKVLSGELAFMPEFVSVFRHEAQIVAALSHENIVPVHNFGEWNGLYYYVMDFVKGGTLEDVRRRNGGRLRPDAAMDLIIAVARGLAHAHAYGVVHRDLKPENILLTHTGTPQITDFGMAHVDRKYIAGKRRMNARRNGRAVSKFHPLGRDAAADPAAEFASSQTQIALEENAGEKPEVVGGTEGYIAPEVERGNAATPRADVYALGALLHFLLTGETPQEPGRLSPEIFKLHNRALADVLARALNVVPTRRYPTAKEFLDALEHVRRAPARRRRRLVASLVALAAALAFSFAFAFGERSQQRKTETRIAAAQKIFEMDEEAPLPPPVERVPAAAASAVETPSVPAAPVVASSSDSAAVAVPATTTVPAGSVEVPGVPAEEPRIRDRRELARAAEEERAASENAAAEVAEREYWERLCAGRTGRRGVVVNFLEQGGPVPEISAGKAIEFFLPVSAGTYNVYLRTDGDTPASSVPLRLAVGDDQISRVVRFGGTSDDAALRFFSTIEVAAAAEKVRIEIPDTRSGSAPAVGLMELELRPTFSGADFSKMFGEFLSALGEK